VTDDRPTSLMVNLPGADAPLDVYSDEGFRLLTELWVKAGWQRRLSYEPTWLGVPVIQLPQDMVMMQELLYKLRPAVVVETGVAHGGSCVLYASILELLGRGEVIGVDVEIRKYNRLAINAHPTSRRITLVEGSSVEPVTFEQVRTLVGGREPVVVALDSNHTRQHVVAEMELYGELVTPGSYLVVFDTVMDWVADTPNGKPEWREEGAGAAVRQFVAEHPEFQVDRYYNRFAATHCPDGFLVKRTVRE
jgi:cephalosporin hydroxylase